MQTDIVFDDEIVEKNKDLISSMLGSFKKYNRS